jgi:hypothetical protein
MKRACPFRIAALALITAAGAAMVFAGPLNPPAGPVASSYKTLTDVEPRIALSAATTPGDADSTFKITQRGSYYLTGNLLGQAGKHGIKITVSNVTVDLMGMELTGVAGSLDGINASGSVAQLTVRNGTVSLWRQDGVDLSSASSSHIDGVKSAVNWADGFRAANTSVLTNCIAQGNVGDGIETTQFTSLTNCTAYSNDEDGIVAGAGASVTGCTAWGNSNDGLVLGDGATATGCTAHSNDQDGIVIGAGASATNCTAIDNGDTGFEIGAAGVAIACTARTSARIGFSVGNGAIATKCTSSLNGWDGFGVSSNATVLDCAATGNGNGAIGAGITLFGTRARIDGNHLTANDFGIRTIGSDNIIVRNSARGNTTANYGPLATEDFGPLTTVGGASHPLANILGD